METQRSLISFDVQVRVVVLKHQANQPGRLVGGRQYWWI